MRKPINIPIFPLLSEHLTLFVPPSTGRETSIFVQTFFSHVDVTFLCAHSLLLAFSGEHIYINTCIYLFVIIIYVFYTYTYLSIYFYLSIFLSKSVCQFIFLSIAIYLDIYQHFYLHIHMLLNLSIDVSLFTPNSLSFRTSTNQ